MLYLKVFSNHRVVLTLPPQAQGGQGPTAPIPVGKTANSPLFRRFSASAGFTVRAGPVKKDGKVF
jgi:hypothetical protein